MERVMGKISALFTFGIGFVVLSAFAAILVVTFGKTYAAQSWPATPCHIQAARTVHVNDSDSDHWEARFSWSYDVAGTHYERRNVEHAAFSVAYERDEAEAIVARYPVGSTATCYYDPEAPNTAYLDRSRPPNSAIALAVGVAAAFVIGAIAAVIRLLKRARTPTV